MMSLNRKITLGVFALLGSYALSHSPSATADDRPPVVTPGPAAATDPAYLIRYKFAAGNVLNYTMTMDMQSSIPMNGKSIPMASHTDMTSTQSVSTVNPDGSGVLSTKINSMAGDSERQPDTDCKYPADLCEACRDDNDSHRRRHKHRLNCTGVAAFDRRRTVQNRGRITDTTGQDWRFLVISAPLAPLQSTMSSVLWCSSRSSWSAATTWPNSIQPTHRHLCPQPRTQLHPQAAHHL